MVIINIYGLSGEGVKWTSLYWSSLTEEMNVLCPLGIGSWWGSLIVDHHPRAINNL